MSPNPENFTTARPVRIGDDLWEELGEAVGKRERSAIIRQLIAAYLGKPGAKMPKRPKAEPPTE